MVIVRLPVVVVVVMWFPVVVKIKMRFPMVVMIIVRFPMIIQIIVWFPVFIVTGLVKIIHEHMISVKIWSIEIVIMLTAWERVEVFIHIEFRRNFSVCTLISINHC